MIAFLGQCRAMDALLVSIINCAVAFGAGLRNDQPGTQQEFSGGFIGEAGLGMGVVETDFGAVSLGLLPGCCARDGITIASSRTGSMGIHFLILVQ